MPLKLRPTGLGSGIDKDRPDYTMYCGEWAVGRIYQTRGGPDSLRWFWSMTVNGPMTRADRVATLEEAKALGAGQRNFDRGHARHPIGRHVEAGLDKPCSNKPPAPDTHRAPRAPRKDP